MCVGRVLEELVVAENSNCQILYPGAPGSCAWIRYDIFVHDNTGSQLIGELRSKV